MTADVAIGAIGADGIVGCGMAIVFVVVDACIR